MTVVLTKYLGDMGELAKTANHGYNILISLLTMVITPTSVPSRLEDLAKSFAKS